MPNQINESMDFLGGCFRIPHDNPPRRLLLLTAYVDETGQEQKDWMFVAGFYGNDEAWNKVATEWPLSLGPQRKHLHINKLRFKLKSEQRMLEAAGAVPEKCGLMPIFGGVRQGDFSDILSGTGHSKNISGYVICLWAMLSQALAGLPEGERLELVMEEQRVFAPYATVAIRALTENAPKDMYLPDGRPKLATWRWASKSSTSLLEPADYFCAALANMHKSPGTTRACHQTSQMRTAAK
jgi:hypothetical protein